MAWSQYPAYVIGSLFAGFAAALSYLALARPQDQPATDDVPTSAVQGTQGDVVGGRR